MMKLKTAMILAAGYGKRMGEIGTQTHKGLLKGGDKCLLDYHLEKLATIGIEKVVLNLHHLGHQIQDFLGDGSQYRLKIFYSVEKELLGTGGGIYQALPLLGKDPFLLLSADVWSEYCLEKLSCSREELAYLVLIDNPSYHPRGDFILKDGRLYNLNPLSSRKQRGALTYGSLAVLDPKLFAVCQPGCFSIIEVLRKAAEKNLLAGEYYGGKIFNTNTVLEWEALQNFIRYRNGYMNI